MSEIFTLSGHGPTLSVDFYNPIVIAPGYEYSLALIGLHTYHSVPNINEGENNKLYYWELGDRTKKQKVVGIPTGAYEIDAIEEYLQKQVTPSGARQSEYDACLSVKPNNNTLKCEIKSKHEIDFTRKDSLATLLGYSARVLKPNILHQSDLPVNIVKVRTVHIDSNITTGAYYNSTPTHTIFEFALNVRPGYAIDIEPKNLIFLKINKTIDTIHNITLNLLDQDGDPVYFPKEIVIVRLQLKRV